ncbi:hypothetical protein ES708_01836 [subsurface metagenome]
MVNNASGQGRLAGTISWGVEDKAGRLLVEALGIFPGQPLGYWLYIGVEGIECHLLPPRRYVSQSDELPVPLFFCLLLSQPFRSLLLLFSLLSTLQAESSCKLPEISRLKGGAAVAADYLNLFSPGLLQNP